MLSFSKMMTYTASKDYLVKENYYQQNSEIGFFYGQGLSHIGIMERQVVTKEIYNKIQLGLNPITGEAMVKNAGDPERRAGMDATFSAPKSVSILDALARSLGDEKLSSQIRTAQDNAVQKAMQKLQARYAYTRIADPDNPGKTIRVQTNGLMWASFLHDTGRETSKGFVDPQIHTHNFIFNVVVYRDENGKNKTLTLSNEELLNNKMYLGQFYRNELAKELNKIGLSTILTDARLGFFELADENEKLLFDKNQMKVFSGRSEEISAAVSEFEKIYKNVDESKLKDIINQAIKTSKKTLVEEEFIGEFLDRALRSGINEETLTAIKSKMELDPAPKNLDPSIIQDHIDKSLEFVTTNESVFTKEILMRELLKYGLDYGLGEADYEMALCRNDNIVQLDDNAYTSHQMLDLEKETITTVLSTKNHFSPIARSAVLVREFCQKNFPTMNNDQRNFVETVLYSTDQFIAVQGKAGTGKTFSAKAIKDYLEMYHPDVEIVGASFMGKAADGLEKDSGIQSSTLDSYFIKEQKTGDTRDKQRILLVDEAGMTGSRQLYKIIEIAKAKNDKIIFIGDSEQFPSIAAGRIFKDMQDFGIRTVELLESIRQKTDYTKEAVESITQKDVVKSLEIVKSKGNLLEIESLEDRMKYVIGDYLKMDQKNRDETIVLAATNMERRFGNTEFRQALGLSNSNVFETKELLSMSGIERYYSMSYEVGDYISPTEKIHGLKNGELLKIIDTSADRQKITIELQGGQKRDVNLLELGDRINVYKNVKKSFDAGDKITFTKNIHSKNGLRVKNGTLDIIKSIDGEGNVLTNAGRKFNLNTMPYLDHAYVITNVKSQGMTADNVYVMAHSRMANLQAFYVEASRTKFELKVLTDDVEKLIENASKEKIKTSTLDYQKEAVLAEVEKRKIQNLTKEKTNGRNEIAIGSNRKESERFIESVHPSREINRGYLQDLSRAIRVAIRTFSDSWLAGRDLKQVRSIARQIEDYQKQMPKQKEKGLNI